MVPSTGLASGETSHTPHHCRITETISQKWEQLKGVGSKIFEEVERAPIGVERVPVHDTSDHQLPAGGLPHVNVQEIARYNRVEEGLQWFSDACLERQRLDGQPEAGHPRDERARTGDGLQDPLAMNVSAIGLNADDAARVLKNAR